MVLFGFHEISRLNVRAHSGTSFYRPEQRIIYPEDHDLTQTEISEILHCSQRVYSNYERGEIEIPTSVLIALADYYHVSVDYILERTDNSTLLK